MGPPDPPRLWQASLARLRCPYCFGALAPDGWSGSVERGLVRCRCARFPVLGGVLIFGMEAATAIVPLIESRDQAALERYLTEEHGVPTAILRGEAATFWDATTVVQRFVSPSSPHALMFDVWMLQLRHWYRTTKYLALLPVLAHLARVRPRVVLDIGAGGGHFGYLASRYGRADELYAVDGGKFALLYLLLARWLLPARSCLIQMDVQLGLPFVDASCDAVISSDALHYIVAKAPLLRDVARVGAGGGAVAFAHLHNALAPSRQFAGWVHDPPGWHQLFTDALGPCRLFADDNLGAAFAAGGDPLATDQATAAATCAAHSVTLLRPGREVARDGFLDEPLGDAILNPIYEVRPEGQQLFLTRRELTPFFEEEWRSPEPPPEATLARHRLTDQGYLATLRRRAILVDAPPAMVDPDPRGLRVAVS